jgi:hypothetical protein
MMITPTVLASCARWGTPIIMPPRANHYDRTSILILLQNAKFNTEHESRHCEERSDVAIQSIYKSIYKSEIYKIQDNLDNRVGE